MRRIKESTRPPWASERQAFAKDSWRVDLYNSRRWRILSKMEIANEPYCAACYAKGVLTIDNLQRDHINGFTNETEFWEGPRQTLCKPCNMSKAGRKGGKK